ncbi:DegQ family serine endoprotease [Chlamydiales bacterium]|nr:DegQ family serine endoprotease [Chlamydiales bacterium]
MHRILYLFMAFYTLPLLSFGESSAEKVSHDFTKVAKKAIPAVVSVTTEQLPKQGANDPRKDLHEFFHDDFFNHFFNRNNPFKEQEIQPSISQGSGVIVSADGIVLTNNHVINEGEKIQVKLNDGREFEAKIIGTDANSDLAVLRIDATNLPYLDLGDSNALEVGEWVIAIGNPLGLQATLTVGVVSAKGRSNLSIANYEDFIQTDAAINRGNSGGALLNLEGKVIGINTAIASSTGGYMGIGFAIPSSIAKVVMDQLLEKGTVTRGYIGVTLQPIDQDLARAFNLPRIEGALVSEVAKDSPAEKAGLKQGDVILKFNNNVIDSIGSFRNGVSLVPSGTAINLSILREGKMSSHTVKVGTLPNSNQEKEENAEAETSIGFNVEPLTQELAESLGFTGEKGVIVSKVAPKSAASFAGIKKGALIMAVNQKRVASVEEFQNALKEHEGEKGVLLLLKQGNVTRYLFLKQ